MNEIVIIPNYFQCLFHSDVQQLFLSNNISFCNNAEVRIYTFFENIHNVLETVMYRWLNCQNNGLESYVYESVYLVVFILKSLHLLCNYIGWTSFTNSANAGVGRLISRSGGPLVLVRYCAGQSNRREPNKPPTNERRAANQNGGKWLKGR